MKAYKQTYNLVKSLNSTVKHIATQLKYYENKTNSIISSGKLANEILEAIDYQIEGVNWLDIVNYLNNSENESETINLRGRVDNFPQSPTESSFNLPPQLKTLSFPLIFSSMLRLSNDVSFMFANCSHLTTLDLSALNIELFNISHMFENCLSLKELNISNLKPESIETATNCFNLSNQEPATETTIVIIAYGSLFNKLCSITDSCLSNDTSESLIDNILYSQPCVIHKNNVAIENINISWSQFKTILDSVTATNYAYESNSYVLMNYSTNENPLTTPLNLPTTLKQFTISLIKLSLNKNISYLFNNCSSLTDITLTGDTILTNIDNLFSNCSSLKNVTIANFKGDQLKSCNSLFSKCESIESINLTSLNNTSSLVSVNKAFNFISDDSAKEITTLIMMRGSMFNYFNSIINSGLKLSDELETLDNEKTYSLYGLSNYNGTIIQPSISWFTFIDKFKNITQKNYTYDKSCVVYMTNYENPFSFSLCRTGSIENLTIDFSKVKSYTGKFEDNRFWSISYMFYYYEEEGVEELVKEIELKNYVGENEEYIDLMFGSRKNLEVIRMSSFIGSNAISWYGVFDGCQNLKLIDLSSCKPQLDKIQSCDSMFRCNIPDNKPLTIIAPGQFFNVFTSFDNSYLTKDPELVFNDDTVYEQKCIGYNNGVKLVSN